MSHNPTLTWMITAAVGLAAAATTNQALADTVTDWNVNLEEVIFATAQTAPAQARSIAIVHAAIYDAVNGIVGKYTPYLVTESAPPGARPEAAAAQAAYTAMKALYPSVSALLDEQLGESLARIPGNSGKSVSIARGRLWGEQVAQAILAAREDDQWSSSPTPYFGSTEAGIWRSPPTPANPDGTLPAAFPQMAILTPFAMSSPSQFRPGPPPALDSLLYATDLNEVKAIGRFDSAVRTADQTQLALLWQAVGPVDENRLARSVVPAGNSLVDNARMFALLNIAACDSLIASFDSKFAYQLWRPYHAVRFADIDGNSSTEADSTWDSLFIAPRFPEYISNHSSLTSGFMNVLAALVGDDQTLTLDSPNHPFTWTFNSCSEVTAQVKEARIWAGIHFRNSCDVGEATGRAVADYVLSNFLLPAHDGAED